MRNAISGALIVMNLYFLTRDLAEGRSAIFATINAVAALALAFSVYLEWRYTRDAEMEIQAIFKKIREDKIQKNTLGEES